MTPASDNKQPPVIWWIIWAALLSGVFVMYFVIGPKAPPPEAASQDSLIWAIGFVPFVVSAIIRWLIFPRVRTFQAAFPLFIVGLALAESACVLGLFVFPTYALQLFLLGVLGIFQWAPYFAGNYSTAKE